MRQTEEITGELIYQNKTRANSGAAQLWAQKRSQGLTRIQRLNIWFSWPVSSIYNDYCLLSLTISEDLS